MPKGDRKILKADPEDGTTPISNLLLEALVIAKLSSKERAALLFLARRTYGWQVNGARLKEVKIPHKEWGLALSMDSSHISPLLAGLEVKGLIKRRYIGPTGPDRGYYYSINTNLTEWGNNCLNQQLLLEIAIIKLPKTVRKVLPKSVTTLGTNYTRGNKIKENLNKSPINHNELENIFLETAPGLSVAKLLRIINRTTEEHKSVPPNRRAFFKAQLIKGGYGGFIKDETEKALP